MFENMSQIAEQAAASVSRRQFLGALGRAAMIVAAATGGMLALSNVTQGAPRPGRLCSANSTQSCLGKVEGAVCFGGGYTGICAGPRRRGDKSTVTDCSCHIEGIR